jgi:hypothetical protein
MRDHLTSFRARVHEAEAAVREAETELTAARAALAKAEGGQVVSLVMHRPAAIMLAGAKDAVRLGKGEHAVQGDMLVLLAANWYFRTLLKEGEAAIRQTAPVPEDAQTVVAALAELLPLSEAGTKRAAARAAEAAEAESRRQTAYL